MVKHRAMQRRPSGADELANIRPMPYTGTMTTLEFSLEISDRLAREAREAGLLAPEALTELIENGVRRKAAQRIRTARAKPGGDAPMTPEDLQAIVKAVRTRKP